MNETTCQLKELIETMYAEYVEMSHFTEESMKQLLILADFQEYEVSRLINKLHYINTKIADNGGFPILKQIYNMI